MQHTLTIKRAAKPAEPPVAEPNRIVFEAIARRLRLEAVYNRQRVILAPHILYTRHDEMHVDAVTLERDGKPPREVKLGTFKLVGLHELRLVEQAFEPDAAFNPGDRRYKDVTLFTI